MSLVIHPEMQALLDANAHLRAELADLLTEAHDLVHVVKPNLLAAYQRKLGPWELDMLRARCAVAKAKRTLELVQAALNRGQAPDMPVIAAQVEEELQLWQVKLNEAVAVLTTAQHRLDHTLPTADAQELKKLYFGLVKQLHPDLHPDQTADRMRLWQQVQDAYNNADLEQLRALSELSPMQPAPADLYSSQEKLTAENAGLNKRLQHVAHKIDEIRKQPPFTLMENLSDEDWISTRREQIEASFALLKQQAATLEAQLQPFIHPPSHVPGAFGSN